MASDVLPGVVQALGIAVFERSPEGGFSALTPLPEWFSRLGRDGTFPFLGHILDEATGFWGSQNDGTREWGPCVEVDDHGKEFHYRVKALNIRARSYLVFQFDEGAEQLREVLQKVRSQALQSE
jgi:hypothetical protein